MPYICARFSLVAISLGLGSTTFLSENPLETTEGSEAVFEWSYTLKPRKQAKFDHVTFGKWHDHLIEEYLITVLVSDESVILEPTMKQKRPHYIRRFSWIGNLTQSRVAFRISNVTLSDAGNYGCRLDIDNIEELVSGAVSLKVEPKSSFTGKPPPQTPVLRYGPVQLTWEYQLNRIDKATFTSLVWGRYNTSGSFVPLYNVSSSTTQATKDPQLMQKENGYPLRLVKRAIVRYYETKRKMYLQSLPENREKAAQQKADNKLRSRRKRLYNARAKVAEGEDKEKLSALSYDYVSDEENGSGENRGKWVVRPPMWRSAAADSLMRRLQGKVEASQGERPRNLRVPGTPSTRSKPRLLVAWATNGEGICQQGVETPTPQRRRPPSPQREQSPPRSRSPSPLSTPENRSSAESRSPSPVIRRLPSKKSRDRTPPRRMTRSVSRSPVKRVVGKGRAKFQRKR